MATQIDANILLVAAFTLIQLLYLGSFLVDFYLFRQPVNWVDPAEAEGMAEEALPYIVLFYPVLRELEETMRTTFTSLTDMDYPKSRYRVIAIPNMDDHATVASLRCLAREFPFLEVMPVPPTSHPEWDRVWRAWDANPHAYWWHRGRRAHERALPPKKTRQLIYAFYHTVEDRAGKGDFLINYIDADSAPPNDHFKAAAAGMRHYDVLQATNVAGNLNDTMAATWHSFDHMVWDGRKYPHVSANGRHPYWVLGKGLFFRAADLVELGGFHPWITIEDPEVGMRMWKNGRRLGIIANPLIEEVPSTIGRGITQRKRWVAGFFQSLALPLREMGFTPMERVKAWMNFLPCMSLWLNAVGLPVGIWAIVEYLRGEPALPAWAVALGLLNLGLFLVSLALIYRSTWKRTALVLKRRRDRIWYMIRINPLSLTLFWLLWLIPLWIGWRMYRGDKGLVWERTVKINANEELVREVHGQPAPLLLSNAGAIS